MYTFFLVALLMFVCGILDFETSAQGYDDLMFYSKLSALNTDSSSSVCIQNYVELTTVREMGCLSGTISSLNRYGIVPGNNTRDGDQ
jgi:hypothetical protein